MAEETLKYNIEINQEDLASQLEQVRNQIDLTLGATAFAQDAPPSASSMVNIPQGGIFAAPDVSGQGIMNNVMAELDQASQFSQLGFTKFQEDARRMGLLANSTPPSYEAEVDLYGRGPGGYFNSALGALLPGLSGFDYDRSGMTKVEYRDQAIDKVADIFDPSQNSFFFSGLGTALGAPLGLGGAIAGFGIGGAVDLVNQFAGVRVRERESLEEGFKKIALQNFGPISRSRAQGMAETLQDRAYSFEGRALSYDMDTMQENIIGFANAGGFANVTSGDEMEDVMQGVVENARQFANNFRMKQQEAVQVMAQLSQNMIVDPSEMGDFSSRMGAFSAFTGMNPVDAVGFGMQGVQMTRGMGIETEASFNMAIEARLQAERLRRADPETRQLINDMGGADNFALSQVENSVRYMSSGAGLLSSAAYLQGGAGGMDSISGLLSQAGNFISGDPLNMFRLSAKQPEIIEQMGLGGMQGMQFNNVFNMAREMGMMPDGNIDEDAMVGIMSRALGISPQQARANLASVRDMRNQDPVQKVYDNFIIESQSRIRENDIGILGGIKGWAGETFVDPVVENVLNPVGELVNSFGEGVQRGFENLSDMVNNRNRVRPIDFSEAESRIASGTANESAMERYREYRESRGGKASARSREDFGEFLSNSRITRSDPIARRRMGDRGFTEEKLYRLTQGLDDSTTEDFIADQIYSTDYTASDFEFFKTASEFGDIGSIGRTPEGFLSGLMTESEIDNLSPGEYMRAMAEKISEARKLETTSVEGLDPMDRRNMLAHYVKRNEGFSYGETEQTIAKTLAYSSNRAAGKEISIDPERARKEAEDLRKAILSKMTGKSSISRTGSLNWSGVSPEDAEKYMDAMAEYATGGETDSFANIAKKHGLNPDRLDNLYSEYGGDISTMTVASTAAKMGELEEEAQNIAAQYGGASETVQRLATSFLGRMKKASLEGGSDVLYQNLSLGKDRISMADLSDAEQQANLIQEYTQNIGQVLRKGSAEQLSALNQNDLDLFEKNNRAVETAVFTRLSDAFDEEGRLKVSTK